MRVTAETKESTRKRILKAAQTLFGRKGYAGTTTRDIAAKAGIATGTLFNYFPNKEALAMVLIGVSLDKAAVDFEKSDHRGESAEEDLFAFIMAGLRRMEPHRAYVAPAFESTLSPFAMSDTADAGARIRSTQVERVAELLGNRGMDISAGASFLTMHLYWTLYMGIVAFWAQDESPHQEDTLAMLDQYLQLFVASLSESQKTKEANCDA